MYPTLAKYNAGNIEKFLNDIDKYSIGMDEWFHRFNSLHQTESNYPPYNVVKESNTATRVEIAIAGFSKKEISVYTENNKLFVEGQKEMLEIFSFDPVEREGPTRILNFEPLPGDG